MTLFAPVGISQSNSSYSNTLVLGFLQSLKHCSKSPSSGYKFNNLAIAKIITCWIEVLYSGYCASQMVGD